MVGLASSKTPTSKIESVGSGLRVAERLTIIVMVLTLVASLGGLFMPGLYRDPAAIIPALQGQDLVTLISMPALILTMLAARRGSARAKLIWIGLLGYVLYTYLGAAVGYYLNNFTLLYIAVFSLSLAALILVVGSINIHELGTSFDGGVPRWPVIAFLLLMAVMLGAREVMENISFIRTGITPAGMHLAGGTNYFVYAFDLGLIVPLSVLSAYWLWRRVAWGFVSTGVVLIKAAVMGLALLAMNGFVVAAGGSTDGMLAVWGFITVGGLGLSVWFLRHCRN